MLVARFWEIEATWLEDLVDKAKEWGYREDNGRLGVWHAVQWMLVNREPDLWKTLVQNAHCEAQSGAELGLTYQFAQQWPRSLIVEDDEVI